MGLELAHAFITISADSSALTTDFHSIEGKSSGFLDRLTGMFTGKMMAALAAVSAGFTTLGALMGAGKFEQTVIAFETMIGSAEETQQTLTNLTEFAAKTPFEMPEIEAAARGLIQFGERGDELMETLNMLGNAASGTSTPFGFLALVFNQVRGVGKLLTQDFRQLSTRGIISLQDIADYYGVATDAAQEMLSKGKISFDDFKKIMASLSSEGGRFANLMEKQSKSLLGLWSTFQDAMGITARQIGEVLVPSAKGWVQSAISIVEIGRVWVQENSDMVAQLVRTGIALGKLAAGLVAAKVAIVAVTLVTKVFTAATKAAAVSQAILTALSGPAGWAKLAVGMAAAFATIQGLHQLMGSSNPEATQAVEKTSKAVSIFEVLLDRLEKKLIDVNKAMTSIEWKEFGADFQSQYKDIIDQFNALIDLEKRMLEGSTTLQERYKGNLDALVGKDEGAETQEEFLKRRKAEMEKLFKEFSGFGELQSVTSKATANPEKELERYRKQLEALREFGVIVASDVERLMTEAYRASPMAKPGLMLGELEKQNSEMQNIIDLGKEEAAIQRKIAEYKELPFVTADDIKAYEELLKKQQELTKELEKQEKQKRKDEEFERKAEAKEKEFMTESERAQSDLSELWQMRQKGLISDENYKRGLERQRSQLQPEAMIGAGRFGFADFGKSIQDAILQRNDPNKVTAEESKKQTGLLDVIKGELEKLNTKTLGGAILG